MKKLLNFIIGYGIFIIIGTAGASDSGNIQFSQSVLRIIIAFGLIGVGILGKKVLGCVMIVKVNKRESRLHSQKEKKLELQVVA